MYNVSLFVDGDGDGEVDGDKVDHVLIMVRIVKKYMVKLAWRATSVRSVLTSGAKMGRPVNWSDIHHHQHRHRHDHH